MPSDVSRWAKTMTYATLPRPEIPDFEAPPITEVVLGVPVLADPWPVSHQLGVALEPVARQVSSCTGAATPRARP